MWLHVGIKDGMTFFRADLRLFLNWALLLAVLARGAIPAGFMPDLRVGAVKIEICTAAGLTSVLVPAGKTPFDGHKDRHDTCPYAPVLAHGFVVATPFLPAVLPRMLPPVAGDFRFIPLIVKPWFAQGPPRA
jgi:hypothetical protein